MQMKQTPLGRFTSCLAVSAGLIMSFCASTLAQSPLTPNGAVPAQSTPTQTTATTRDSQVSPDSMMDKRALKIGGGDLLDVKVYGVPELTDSVRVSSRGD